MENMVMANYLASNHATEHTGSKGWSCIKTEPEYSFLSQVWSRAKIHCTVSSITTNSQARNLTSVAVDNPKALVK